MIVIGLRPLPPTRRQHRIGGHQPGRARRIPRRIAGAKNLLHDPVEIKNDSLLRMTVCASVCSAYSIIRSNRSPSWLSAASNTACRLPEKTCLSVASERKLYDPNVSKSDGTQKPRSRNALSFKCRID